jgi:hypothetical protein
MDEIRHGLSRDQLESHLSTLMQAACSDPSASALLVELGDGDEGTLQIDMSFGSEHPIAVISDQLDLANAEATTLHEAGHWLEGHVRGLPSDGNYQGAVIADRMNGTATRGNWEQDADRRALALLKEDPTLETIEASTEVIESILVDDALKYGSFSP